MKTILMSGDALVTDEYWQITGDAGNGTLMTFSPDPRKNPEAKPIVDELQAAGRTAEGYSLYTYAAVKIWADAVKAAGTTDFDKVTAEMYKTTFNTVLGKLNFDKKGDVTLPGYVVYEWKNGKYDYLHHVVPSRSSPLAAVQEPRRQRRGFCLPSPLARLQFGGPDICPVEPLPVPALPRLAACLIAAAGLLAAGAAEADTVIGVAGPMSGSFAVFGERDARRRRPGDRRHQRRRRRQRHTAGAAGDGRQVRSQDRRCRRQPARRQGRRHGRRPSLPGRIAGRGLGLCRQPHRRDLAGHHLAGLHRQAPRRRHLPAGRP